MVIGFVNILGLKSWPNGVKRTGFVLENTQIGNPNDKQYTWIARKVHLRLLLGHKTKHFSTKLIINIFR